MVAGRVDPISAINPTKTYWIIKVRVVRIWLMPTYPSTSSNHGIEMVLCDSELSLINSSKLLVANMGHDFSDLSCIKLVHLLVFSEVRVEGLETLDYFDKLHTEQDNALTFESEVSLVFPLLPISFSDIVPKF
ncbi:putative glucose-6-phosphate 1-epimerase [Senna tora]|uniref:Putative glucose-6-phosphate 1-epimerase n=1 Tax=Senna tora TaxID=362788 RepID=A0A834T0T2_9FABA|nr:putative glucose-6-phosphate 1-epimerase [Senna tora]